VRGNLILIELLVMLLVFSLAAAACLGIFAQARLMTEETARLDEAVALARNAAELLKAGRDLQTLDTGELRLEITELPGEIPGMMQAEIAILDGETTVFSLTTGWQEVAP
jgi:type II secretory pathway pseudopilin PulG